MRDFTLEFFVHRRCRETRIGEARRGAPHGPRMLTRRERELLPDEHVLAMRMYVPRVENGIYYDTDHIRDVVVHDPSDESDGNGGPPCFLHHDTTTLVQLRVDRVTDYVTVGIDPREH